MDMAVAISLRFAMLFYTGIIPQMHCHKLPDKRIPANSKECLQLYKQVHNFPHCLPLLLSDYH